MSAAATALPHVIVIGAGPAGLMAAETLAACGVRVQVADAMASAGRKFLLAGKSGMNLTHAEPTEQLISRYLPAESAQALAPVIRAFDGNALRDWARQLGIATFVGSSERVFPVDMKAAPLLRAWLHRLRGQGVEFLMRHRWQGWSEDGRRLCFSHPDGVRELPADAVILALGGASWARLGSDGAWWPLLQQRGVGLTRLQPSNCGFDCSWSPYFSQHFAGQALPTVAARLAASGQSMRKGQFVISAGGVEGSLIYALSAALRERILQQGQAVLELDLMPDWTAEKILQTLQRGRGSRSFSSYLQNQLKLDKLKIALLYEVQQAPQQLSAQQLCLLLKQLPVTLLAARPIDEAISSAGGVRFDSLSAGAMLTACPGVFCAGEMLDWEAPTGGYLLTACFATGKWAAESALDWLARR